MNTLEIPHDELITLRYSMELAIAALSKTQAFLRFNEPESDEAVIPQDDVCFDSLLQDEFWRHDSRKGIMIPIGKKSCNENLCLSIGDALDNYSVQISGLPGSGKTTLLNTIITGASMMYSPAQLKFILLDASGVNEFTVFKDLPHLANLYFIHTEDDYNSAIQALSNEITTLEEEYAWYADKYKRPCSSHDNYCSLSNVAPPVNLSL